MPKNSAPRRDIGLETRLVPAFIAAPETDATRLEHRLARGLPIYGFVQKVPVMGSQVG